MACRLRTVGKLTTTSLGLPPGIIGIPMFSIPVINAFIDQLHMGHLLVVGGDDLKLKGWDKRCAFTHPVFVNKRYGIIHLHTLNPIKSCRFDAGVTSIQSHPHVEHLMAVGRPVPE